MSEEIKKTETVAEPAKEVAAPAKKFYKHRPNKKKVCIFCENKDKAIDYKDIATLRKFVTEKGKILPCRQTGTCAKHQRELTVAIKRARNIALLPFKGE
ncbi:MAG: 30S ribosomal protein S18 [Clostridia bacterium]|nr:30S ribosomal protein S18 [Clostridia bacterium]